MRRGVKTSPFSFFEHIEYDLALLFAVNELLNRWKEFE
jgi:hypothetical protein